MMTPDERQQFEQKLSDMSIAQLEAEKARYRPNTEWRSSAERTLETRRAVEQAAADAPTATQ